MRRRLRQWFCRHLNCEIVLRLDGPAPGWQWICWTCGKHLDTWETDVIYKGRG